MTQILESVLENAIVFLLAYAGLCCLCLAMERHYAALHGRGAEPPPALRRQLSVGGWLMLAIALAWAMQTAGPAYGLLLWTGGLTGCALLLILLLPYAPRQAPRLAWVAAAATLPAALGLLLVQGAG